MSSAPETAMVPSPVNMAAMSDPNDLLWDAAAFAHAQRVGAMFASSHLVPEHMRGKPADCAIALMMAKQLGENPLVVLQSIYVVSGKAGWSAQYIIARANKSGLFRSRLNWRVSGKGDTLEVTAFALLADSGEEVSFTASMAMAKAEGWTKNPKYASMGELMLRYRSATLLVRLYCPEVMLGMQTAEEIEDVEVTIVPRRGPPQVVLPSEVATDGPLDLREHPPKTALGALGLAPAKPAPVSAAVEADRAEAAARRAALKPGDPKADAEALAAVVGDRRVASSEAKDAFKVALGIQRLDVTRWSAAVAYAAQNGLVVEVDGAFRKLALAEVGNLELSGDALRDELQTIERDMDPEDVARIYRASFEQADDNFATFNEASDAQLRRYLDALLDSAGV